MSEYERPRVPRKQVVVELTPTRLEVATLHGGRVEASRCERMEPGDWSESWPAALIALDETLARLVTKLGVQGAPATILYAAPTGASAVFSCPSSAGAVSGEQAA